MIIWILAGMVSGRREGSGSDLEAEGGSEGSLGVFHEVGVVVTGAIKVT